MPLGQFGMCRCSNLLRLANKLAVLRVILLCLSGYISECKFFTWMSKVFWGNGLLHQYQMASLCFTFYLRSIFRWIDRQKQYSDENGCKICCQWKHYPLCIWHNFILILDFRSLLQHLQSEAFIFSDKPELHQVSFNLQHGSAQLTA